MLLLVVGRASRLAVNMPSVKINPIDPVPPLMPNPTRVFELKKEINSNPKIFTT